MDSARLPQPAETYLLLQLGTRRCALARGMVREILPLPRLWRPPGLPGPLAGFMNLGGEALPVLDLARLFGVGKGMSAEDALYRHVILASPANLPGLLVDRVLDFVSVPAAARRVVRPDATLNGCATAELPVGEGFAHLLSPERILLAQEQASLAALREAAQARIAEWGAA